MFAKVRKSEGSSKTKPSSPEETTSEPPLFREVMIGNPQAMASAGGRANASSSDGLT